MSETKQKSDWSDTSSGAMNRSAILEIAESGDGKKLTPLRQAVLDALVRADRPLGAYDLLARIEISTGKRLMPPSVYRALEFLRERGMVARIECLNAFRALHADEPVQANAYFICDQCGTTRAIEDPSLGGLIEHQAQALGFEIGTRVVEMKGICHRCREIHPTHLL